MNEAAPRNLVYEAGMVLQRQDEADPIRGPVVNLARRVKEVASADIDTPLWQEFYALQTSFRDQFRDPAEALRYRLYHYILGSSVEASNDLFDIEGPKSVAESIRSLAKKYNIDTDEV